MTHEAIKLIPSDQMATQIVRVANGWVFYAQAFGYDISNDRARPPQLVFNCMSDAVCALIEWGKLHEGKQ